MKGLMTLLIFFTSICCAIGQVKVDDVTHYQHSESALSVKPINQIWSHKAGTILRDIEPIASIGYEITHSNADTCIVMRLSSGQVLKFTADDEILYNGKQIGCEEGLSDFAKKFYAVLVSQYKY